MLNSTAFANSITILQTICWTLKAWKTVDSTVIQKCFRRCGFLNKDFNAVSESPIDKDPFCDQDPSMLGEEAQDPELADLI